jgi:hypothetical protein
MTKSFESHVTTLLSLIRDVGHSQGEGLSVFSYVAAQSYPAMLQKFLPGSDSKHFIDCLLGLAPEQVLTSERPFPAPQPIDTPLGKQDIAFIKLLVQPVTEHFLKLSENGISALVQLAKHYPATPAAELPAFYTRDTCKEFHRLLCHLLRCFETSLHDLRDYPYAELHTEAFDMAVYHVATCGLTLWSLVYSSFLEEHLWRIQAPNPLALARRVDAKSSGDAALGSEGTQLQPWWFSGRDSGSLAVCTAYTDCLRSQIAHFEAANYLMRSASTFREGAASFKVVTFMECGGAMRLWRDIIAELVGRCDFCNFDAQEVVSMIERKLAPNAILASRLDGEEQLFCGTLHSNVCLASLINPDDTFETDGSNEYAVSTVFTTV